MEHFIEKNILIDDLFELEIYNIEELLDIFNELRNTNDIDSDIKLLTHCMHIIDRNIWETEEYIKSITISIDDLEIQNNYISNYLNDLYIGKHKIQTFINRINKIDIMADLISEMNIK